MNRNRLPLLRAALAAAALLCACAAAAQAPDYQRQLPAGASALRRLAPAEVPDLAAAFAGRDEDLAAALDRSLGWFGREAAEGYPFEPLGLDRERARAGVAAFARLLQASATAAEFRERVLAEFDVYASAGWDGSGAVLFTGYYAPVHRASRTRTDVFRFPLYGRPAGLAVNARGDPLTPYPTRAEIDRDPAALGLAGREVAWLADELEAYLIGVQGSARLELEGGEVLHVGFDGSNGREYTSIGRLLAADGKMERGKISVQTIRAYFREHPEELDGYTARNDRFIFFREETPGEWPAGSLTVPVTPRRTLATDKSLYPRGGAVLVSTALAKAGEGSEPFEQFMLDQDAGGGIRAPGRADIYLGVGDEAGEIAGRQAYQGRLYYFVLKPERVAAWKEPAHEAEAAAAGEPKPGP